MISARSTAPALAEHGLPRWRYALRRAAGAVLSAAVAASAAFLITHALPGDAALTRAGVDAPPEVVEALRRQLGLDAPAPVALVRWMAGAVRGDLGTSVRFSRPVASLVGEHFRVNLLLVALAMPLALVLALAGGTVAAVGLAGLDGWGLRRRLLAAADRALSALMQLGLSVPSFWVAMVLVWGVAVRLRILPAVAPVGEGGLPEWRGLVLPVMALALPAAGALGLMVRASVAQGLEEPFVQAVRARGAGLWRVVVGHVLPGALNPVVSALGVVLADLLTGSLVVEMVFGLPGMGRILLAGVEYRDLPLVTGGVAFAALVVVTTSAAVDLLYGLLDPRVRYR